MAITVETRIDKIEVLPETGVLQIRSLEVIMSNGAEIGRGGYSRRTLSPVQMTADGVADTDISGEPAEVRTLAEAVWTKQVRDTAKAVLMADANTPVAP